MLMAELEESVVVEVLFRIKRFVQSRIVETVMNDAGSPVVPVIESFSVSHKNQVTVGSQRVLRHTPHALVGILHLMSE